MNILDRNLVRAINTGHSFALVGSGPSCDLGMPSWRDLAIRVAADLKEDSVVDRANKLIANKEFARVFGLAATTAGIDRLTKTIQEAFVGDWPFGRIYQTIASWPFRSYLTTNFDDQLLRHLKRLESDAVVRFNSEADMSLLHSTTANVVFKIHGDLSDAANIVLTDSQYTHFQSGESRQYWRDTIFALLRMVDLIVIGYSASDPDFNDQLERANRIASPDHPVFLFASGVDQTTVDKYFVEKNIRIIPYTNPVGSRSGLARVLSRYQPFIAKRGGPAVGMRPPDPNATLASSIHLFTTTRLSEPTGTCIARSCAALLLQVLSTFPPHQPVKFAQLLDTFKARVFSRVGVDPDAIQAGLRQLHSRGLIEIPASDEVVVHSNGVALLVEVAARRRLIEDQFDGTCRTFLSSQYADIGEPETKAILAHIKDGLIRAFESRGMKIARSVFSDTHIDVSDATDILEVVNHHGAELPTLEERAAFADLMIEVLLGSNRAVKEYLGMVSQGYFAYHALALDQNCSDDRLALARRKVWILDSSVVLALLAVNSLNYDYARDLLGRMRSLAFRFATTEKLLSEVQDHAYWAIANFGREPADSPRLLLAAQAGPGYKQNLFIDGFTKWSFGQSTPRMETYLTDCLGDNYAKELRDAIKERIHSLGIDVLRFSDWPNFKEELFSERDGLSQQIAESRKTRLSYTGVDQCDAEAEVVLIARMTEARFLSQSGFLDKFATDPVVWKPETMFRFLSLFSEVPPGNDMLYQCMTQDFFYAGFDIIDQQSIANFASPLVHQARMKLQEEHASYERVLGKQRVAELEARFEQIPDQQKPFYSMQFAFYVASQAEEMRRAAVQRASVAEATSQLTQKERKQLERLKDKESERKRKARDTKRIKGAQPKSKKHR